MFHRSFYSQTQQPSFHNNHGSNHFSMPSQASFYQRAPTQNQSSNNIKLTRDFERFSMPPHGFSSMPTGASPFYDATNQQRWRQNMSRNQNQYRQTPAFHFQDKSTYYYMCDPIVNNDNRITIQLTKVHVGLNGDQQRVFVEQEFSNENQLKKFIRNLRENFEKTFNNRATGMHSSNENIDENQTSDNKKSGVIVVEEPDEEPIIYDQQAYNENIQSKIKSPLINSSKLNEPENNPQSSLILSCSTIRSNKQRGKNKMKYRRQKFDYPTQNDKSYNYYGQPPPRFQQRFSNKENHFRMKNDFNNQNSHWKFNGYSRSYIPPSRFADSKNPHKPQPSSRFHQQGQRQNQPTTIAENLVFTNNKQEQTSVQRTRSDCRTRVPFRNHNKTHQHLDNDPNLNRQCFMPFNLPQRTTPIRLQAQYRLFNPYRPNSNRF